jgi:hypothetical protein
MKGRAREGDGALLAYGGGIVVADRGPVGDRSGSRDRAGGRQQRLDQSRLPRTGVTDEHHVAYVDGRNHRRRCAGDPFLRVFLGHGNLLVVFGTPHILESHTSARELTTPTHILGRPPDYL